MCMSLPNNIYSKAYLCAVPPERLVMPSSKAMQISLNAMGYGEKSGAGKDPGNFSHERPWALGGLTWEAYMRNMDRMVCMPYTLGAAFLSRFFSLLFYNSTESHF